MNASTRRRAFTALVTGALALLASPVARAEDATQERFEKTYELTGVRKVRLQNVNGPVSIESGGEFLKVVAVKSVRRESDADLLKETEIRVTKTGPSIDIETVLPKKGRSFTWFLFGRSSSA